MSSPVKHAEHAWFQHQRNGGRRIKSSVVLGWPWLSQDSEDMGRSEFEADYTVRSCLEKLRTAGAVTEHRCLPSVRVPSAAPQPVTK